MMALNLEHQFFAAKLLWNACGEMLTFPGTEIEKYIIISLHLTETANSQFRLNLIDST